MHPRVTAILVARNGAAALGDTLPALAAQQRRPDALIVVDAGSSDRSGERLAGTDAEQLIRIDGRPTFGRAVAHAVAAIGPAGENDWLWLLGHDNTPDPGALAALLDAVEIAPSVSVAGPKLMRADDPGVIAEYGETLTRFGASVSLVRDELDQAQHDVASDVLGVSAHGMLVRRSVWDALGGFDPGLPTADAGLDLCVRARLAGHRVVGVPDARVGSAGGPETFGRESVSAATGERMRRAAQLHRRLAYAPAAAVPVHWLSLLPLALVRSAGHLLAKRPTRIAGEFAAAVAAMAAVGRILAARRRIRRTRRVGWSAIEPLRMPWEQLRELRASQRAARRGVIEVVEIERPAFFESGGGWMLLLTAVLGGVSNAGLFGAATLTGGGMLPLSADIAELWGNAGYGWRDVAGGFVGAADPFAAVLAVLGSITFWDPRVGVVALYLAALPLAALGAWWCAAHVAQRAWAANTAALLWAVAPPLLAGLWDGRLGAVLVHLLLPWLVLAAVSAARSWAASATAALLFAATAASAPSLVPALLLAWLLLIAVQPRRAHRLIGIPLPAAALFAPLVIDQVLRGNPLGLLADPGVPVPGETATGWQLALGSPDGRLLGWPAIVDALALGPAAAPIVVVALLAPIAALAALALLVDRSARVIPALVLAALGYVTAVAAGHVQPSAAGAELVPIWPGAGLSLYWLGLAAAAGFALSRLRRAAAAPALVAAAGVLIAVAPLLAAPLTGGSAVSAGTGRTLPAYVDAEARGRPGLGTLVLAPQQDGGIAADIQRGSGVTLDDQSTLAATALTLSPRQQQVATLAANIAAPSGWDAAPRMSELGIGFVLLDDASGQDDAAVRRLAAESLDANEAFAPVGETSHGLLWRFVGEIPPFERETSPLTIPVGIGLGLVFLVTVLLAVPTSPGPRRVAVANDDDELIGFGEDEDA